MRSLYNRVAGQSERLAALSEGTLGVGQQTRSFQTLYPRSSA
jgi:hypothetical protein